MKQNNKKINKKSENQTKTTIVCSCYYFELPLRLNFIIIKKSFRGETIDIPEKKSRIAKNATYPNDEENIQDISESEDDNEGEKKFIEEIGEAKWLSL